MHESSVGCRAVLSSAVVAHACSAIPSDSEMRSVSVGSNIVGDLNDGQIPIGRPPGRVAPDFLLVSRRVRFSSSFESRDCATYLQDLLSPQMEYRLESWHTQDFISSDR
jgi:hypothetical protein